MNDDETKRAWEYVAGAAESSPRDHAILDLRRRVDALHAALDELTAGGIRKVNDDTARLDALCVRDTEANERATAALERIADSLAPQSPPAAPASRLVAQTADVLGSELHVGDVVVAWLSSAGWQETGSPPVVRELGRFDPGHTYRVRLPRPEPAAPAAEPDAPQTADVLTDDLRDGDVVVAFRLHNATWNASDPPVVVARGPAQSWVRGCMVRVRLPRPEPVVQPEPPPAPAQAREIARVDTPFVYVGTTPLVVGVNDTERCLIADTINRALAEALDSALAEVRAERDFERDARATAVAAAQQELASLRARAELAKCVVEAVKAYVTASTITESAMARNALLRALDAYDAAETKGGG